MRYLNAYPIDTPLPFDILFRNISSVTVPEKNWLQHAPYITITPMLAKDVGRIDLARNVT